MPRFLPRSIQDYAIPRPAPTDFTHAAASLLEDIGRKMSVDKARSEGRIPSPFSRSFVFYLNLYGKGLRADTVQEDGAHLDRGREALQAEARRTFRGISAAFALRKILGLRIRESSVMLNPSGGRLERALAAAVDSAPRGKDYWNPLRFFTVRQSEDTQAEVLAGLSPLTAFAPAARPPARLTALFWYDPGAPGQGTPARWYDPTAEVLSEDESFRLHNPLTIRTVRRLLRAWLARACETTAVPTALAEYGLTPGDGKLLHNELQRWLTELGGELREEGLVEAEAIPSDRKGSSAPAFLEYACQPTTRDLFGELLGDLPSFNGRLLVTREQLLDPNVRLFGRLFGRPSLTDAVDRLPRQGENLGLDLGLGPDLAPIGYLFVDQLFAPRLTLVTEKGLSDPWKGLEIDGDHYLLPFRPEILNLMSPGELHAATRGQRDRKGEQYIVTLTFGSEEITQLYSISGHGEYTLDGTSIPPEHLDIRVFPNFDLDSSAGAPDSSALAPEDRRYYARVRMSPVFPFRISPFRYEEATRSVRTDVGTEVRLGPAQSYGDRDKYHPGQVSVFTMEQKPSGFYVEERGLCLVSFPVPRGTPATWQVGVDFGTSNTCVTYRPSSDAAPQILRFPVLTTTLLRVPRYSAEFDGPAGTRVNEGASALLDFLFKQQDTDDQLSSGDYFPTQIVTRHREVQPRWAWDYEGGLIYFKNVSLANPIIWELIQAFPEPDDDAPLRHGKEFRLNQDLKWEHTHWLRVFMRHLRLQVLMTAARNRGAVAEIRFSYPKAFSFTQKEEFGEVLRDVWNPHGETGKVSTWSESEAVRSYIVRQATEYVVFDVGGGTTDLIGFSTHEPIFQTSFKLAAGHVNRFVVASRPLREAFLDAFAEKLPNVNLPPKIAALFRDDADHAGSELLNTIWLGLLELIEQNDTTGRKVLEVLGVLRRRQGDVTDPAIRSIRGFFLSLSLLFGGLAYFAGLLMRAASDGRFDGRKFDRRAVDLVLTGNGGKLYNMLDHVDASFKPVIQGMFASGLEAADKQDADGAATVAANDTPREGSGLADARNIGFDGLFKLDGRAAPKVTVALGLLQQPGNDGGKAPKPIPLANIVGEDGYEIKGSQAKFDADLVDFYRDVHQRMREFNPPAQVPRQLRRCLEALNRLLPNGVNHGMPVIPRAGSNWHLPLIGQLYPDSARHVRTRVVENATVLARDLENNRISEEDVPAQEPLFIVELAALLDQIRKEYA